MSQSAGCSQQGICFVWTGDKYSIEDVKFLLKNMRALQQKKYTYYCLTDHHEVDKGDLDLIWIPLKTDWQGWWNKIHLFSPSLALPPEILYVDLDSFFLTPFKDLFSYLKDFDFLCAQDFLLGLSSSMMLFRRKSPVVKHLWEAFCYQHCLQNFRSDQNYIASILEKHGSRVAGLPDFEHYSYKYLINHHQWQGKCENPFVEKRKFSEIRSLNFHGSPKVKDLFQSPDRWSYTIELQKVLKMPKNISELKIGTPIPG